MFFVLQRLRIQRRQSPTQDDTDGDLINRARDGDLDAYNILVDRYRDAVYGVSLRYMRRTDLADDVTQDAFLRAYDALDTFRNDEGRGFKSWLLRIATNRALDVLRYEGRRPAGSLDAALDNEESSWEPETETDHPVDLAEQAALHRHLERALGELPEDQRLAVILFDVEGYSYEEISEISGVAVGTVKSRLHRGRGRLREILNERESGRELLGHFTRL
ncbi:MAG: sigma-70 family RNA polymerase sigma factor [Thermomicrobiales bacterium]